MNAVVAMLGSSATARAPIARVAAAASSSVASSSIGTNTCTPFAPLVFTAPSSPTSASACRTRWATCTTIENDASAVRRVEVEHQMRRSIGTIGAHQRRVVLDGPLVGEPQQRPAVVAQRVGHLALRRLGPQRHRAHPVRRVLRHVLLHERVLAAMHADHRQRPVAEHGQDAVRHGVEVVDEVALRRAGAVEQRLIEVGERDADVLVVGAGSAGVAAAVAAARAAPTPG